ncbi:MAG: thioredoxin [Oscillospiraceae bacterium]|nr:thioredoxin [Oscillospiraceae bacterium]
MAVLHIEDAAEFAAEVLDAEGKVLVDFWASWCGPCMMMAPVLEELDKAYPAVTVAKVNVDELGELAMQYSIDSIPAFLLFEGGKVTKRAIGAMPMETLAAKLGL